MQCLEEHETPDGELGGGEEWDAEDTKILTRKAFGVRAELRHLGEEEECAHAGLRS